MDGTNNTTRLYEPISISKHGKYKCLNQIMIYKPIGLLHYIFMRYIIHRGMVTSIQSSISLMYPNVIKCHLSDQSLVAKMVWAWISGSTGSSDIQNIDFKLNRRWVNTRALYSHIMTIAIICQHSIWYKPAIILHTQIVSMYGHSNV